MLPIASAFSKLLATLEQIRRNIPRETCVAVRVGGDKGKNFGKSSDITHATNGAAHACMPLHAFEVKRRFNDI